MVKARSLTRSEAGAVRGDAYAKARAGYKASRGEVDAARIKAIAAVRSARAADREYFRIVDTVVCPPPES